MKTTYQQYQTQYNFRNITGAQAARFVLDHNGLSGIRIEQTSGTQTNHYDPSANIGFKLTTPVILVGLLLGSFLPFFSTLAHVNVACFALCTVFQLIALPTEFYASKRALQRIESNNLLYGNELDGAKKVLTAVLTYVAALAVSIIKLLRYVLILGKRRR